MFDTWSEYNRECTSYTAWMLHSVNGFEMPFHDDAVNWGPDATARGYTVNMTPAVGSIYWSSSSDHVAYVQSVSSDRTHVDTTDYNSAYTGLWAQELNVATSSASGYIHFKDVGTSSLPLRIGVLRSDGHYQVKEGNLSNQWNDEWTAGGVTSGMVSGDVIGIVTNDGHFYVKENNLSSAWNDEWPTGGVTAGYVSGKRIGILTSDGTFRVKDGALDAQWTIVAYGVSQAALSGSLIGVIESGTFYVKQGSLGAAWTNEYSNVASGMLSDATSNTALRIGVRLNNGTFMVKEGSLTALWTTEATVSQGVVSGALVGALEGSSFYVKQGGLGTGWTDEWDTTTAGSLWSQ
jgi:hypothetical protein